MNIDTLIERTQTIRSTTVDRTIKQRMAEAASNLSLAGSNQMRIESITEAVLALTNACYEADPDGGPANLDNRTHRLLIAAPWGRAGWKKWNLRYWEAEMLRQIMIVRCQMRRVDPLFDYNSEARTWHVDLAIYPRLDQALLYWKSNPITLKEFRRHADVYRERAHARTIRNREAKTSE